MSGIYLFVGITIFFAGFTQGLSGFGSTLLAIPILTVLLDIKTVIPLTALTGLVMTLFLLIQLWRHLVWKKIISFLIGMLPGIPLGVFFLKKVDKGIVQLLLGSLLITYSVYSLISRASPKGTRDRWAYFLGFFGGCLSGAFSASGPAVILYTSLQDWSKDQMKAAIQGMFTVSGAIVVFFYALSGLMTPLVLKYFGVSLPALFLGTYAGSLFYGRINDTQYKKIMFVLLGLLGVFMVWQV